ESLDRIRVGGRRRETGVRVRRAGDGGHRCTGPQYLITGDADVVRRRRPGETHRAGRLTGRGQVGRRGRRRAVAGAAGRGGGHGGRLGGGVAGVVDRADRVLVGLPRRAAAVGERGGGNGVRRHFEPVPVHLVPGQSAAAGVGGRRPGQRDRGV